MEMLNTKELTPHNHLCQECGATLYRCDWCNETEDHRVSGKCDECWAKLGEFWVIQWASSYGIEIMRAYHPDNSSGCADWYKSLYLVGVADTHVGLEEICLDDLPDRQADGEFRGCSNTAWILTEEEKEYYVGLNESRIAEKQAKRSANVQARRNQIAMIFVEAERTGRPQQINSWMTNDCTKNLEDCSFDHAIKWANPDGSEKITYTHCF